MTNETRTEVEQVKEAEVEQVKQQADVKQALKQTSSIKPEEKPKAETKDKLVLSTHVIMLMVLGALRYVLQLPMFECLFDVCLLLNLLDFSFLYLFYFGAR